MRLLNKRQTVCCVFVYLLLHYSQLFQTSAMSRAASYVTLKSQIASHKCLEILSTTPTDGFKVLCPLCGKSFDVKKKQVMSRIIYAGLDIPGL